MEPVGIAQTVSLVQKVGSTLYGFYSEYKKDRYNEFIQCLDITYETGTEETRRHLNEFINRPTGRAILGERLESIMSTDSKRVLMIQALLLCKDPDCWPGEAIEKRIIFALQSMTDEIIDTFKFCTRLRTVETNLDYDLCVFDHQTDLSILENVSQQRVMATVEDLKRRSLFISDTRRKPSNLSSSSMVDNWYIVFGITEEALALSKLIQKAELLLL